MFERSPRGVRKIVAATNIAEASITIPSITFVVDCGFCKLRAYNAKLGVECLVTQMTSRASAQQRAGRAGRSRAGQVRYRGIGRVMDMLQDMGVEWLGMGRLLED